MSFDPKIQSCSAASQAAQTSSALQVAVAEQSNTPVKKLIEFPFVLSASQSQIMTKCQIEVFRGLNSVVQKELQSFVIDDADASAKEGKVVQKINAEKVAKVFSELDTFEVADAQKDMPESAKYYFNMCIDLLKDDTINFIKKSELLASVFTGERPIKFLLACAVGVAAALREENAKIANIKPEILDTAFGNNKEGLEEIKKISFELGNRVADFSIKELEEMLKKVTLEKIEDLDKSQFSQDHWPLAQEVVQILKEACAKGPYGDEIVGSLIIGISFALDALTKEKSQDSDEKKEKPAT